MIWVALKMLTGDGGKYLGLVLGVALATFLMSQQTSILIGVIRRHVSVIEDVGADVWVMNSRTEELDVNCPMPRGVLPRVRGVPGVHWAVPFYKGTAQVVREDGLFRDVILLAVDDGSLAGAPNQMLAGSATDLRLPNAVLIDRAGYEYLWPGEEYQLGRVLKLNDRRVVLVGVCQISPPFLARPVFYTRCGVARDCLDLKQDRLPFLLVKLRADCHPEEVCRAIEQQTGCQALTGEQFMWATAWYIIRYTAIVPNFAITIALGFVVGAAISGQLFHLFVLEHLSHFGLLMAMGTKGRTVARMVLLQTAVVASQGLALGLGFTALFFALTSGTTTLAGLCLYWQAAAATIAAVLLFMAAVGLLAVRRILSLEPAVILRG